LFWHSEKYKENDYHLFKTNKCELKNIKLFHFFEDEILNKTDVIISLINHKLWKFNDFILSSECKIKEIKNTNIVSKFLNENSLNELTDSNINIGLFYNNELVLLLSLNQLKNKNFVLVNFVTKKNIFIISGYEKLLKYFVINYNPQIITKFCDKRLLEEEQYKNLGFVLKKSIKPHCFFIKCGLKFRFKNFLQLKDYLINKGFNPNEINIKNLKNFDSYKIYDCGQSKYELTF
jgi:hypothetical protein